MVRGGGVCRARSYRRGHVGRKVLGQHDVLGRHHAVQCGHDLFSRITMCCKGFGKL